MTMSSRPRLKEALTVALIAAVAVAVLQQTPSLRKLLRETWYERWLFPLLWGAVIPFALIAAWGTVHGLVNLVRAIAAAPASTFDNLGEYFLIGMAIGALISLASSRR